MKPRSLYFLIVFFVLTSTVSWAEEISFTATVNRNTISLSDRLIYTLTIKGGRISSLDLPSIPGFEILSRSGPNYGLDKNTHRTVTEFNYTLMPLASGKFTIPSITQAFMGNTYHTRRIPVNIVDGPSPISRTDNMSPGSFWPAEAKPGTPPLIFITSEVDRHQAYVNEQVTLRFKFYTRNINVTNLQYASPRPTGFIEENFGDQRKYEEYHSQCLYNVIEFSKAIFPTNAGKISIGQAEFHGDIPGTNRSWQSFVLSSPPISLTVQSLPLIGRPSNFRGAVGEFDFGVYYWPTEIRLTEPITVTMQISGRGNLNAIVLPEIPGGESFQIGAAEVTTQKDVKNGRIGGKKTSKQVLLPLSTDIQELPPISFSYFDPGLREYRKITATPAPQIFITTEVDKEYAYVNEQINLKFKLYTIDIQVVNLEITHHPTTGFIKEKLEDKQEYIEDQEGLRYKVQEPSWAIFPISSGKITIGAAELKGDIIIHRSRRKNFLGAFFMGSSVERQPFALRSNPIKLTIKPLPMEDRPDDFKGAVGEFQFDLSASPTTVKVGEPITVTMTITGAGNLDTVFVPEIPCEDAFKTYDPEIADRRRVRGGRVGGEKTFKQVIIPLSIETKEIPAISFSYFNPSTRKYRTITKPPILIKVAAAPDQGPVSLVEGAGPGPGRERIKLLEKDILYIKDSSGHLSQIGRFYYHRPIYWIIPIAALVGLFAVWGIQSRREKLRSDLIYARQVGASRSARKRFKKARTFLNAEDSEKFYGEVHRAFNRYLGDKLGIPAGAVGSTVVAEKLSSAGASAEIIKEVETCFSDFDLARFARSSSDEKKMKTFLDRMECLLGRLEKARVLRIK